MLKNTIYALFYMDGDIKRYFYVGRSKDPSRRFKEHRYQAGKGPEDKYLKIRELDANGIPWSGEVIQPITDESYIPDAERSQVIKLTRDGHELMNMRHGSKEQREWLASQVVNPRVRTIADVRREREAEEHGKYNGSRKLRERIDFSLLVKAFRNGVAHVGTSPDIPEVYKAQLGQDNSIKRGNWTDDEVRDILNADWKRVEELVYSIRTGSADRK